jgi:hypothetical protein
LRDEKILFIYASTATFMQSLVFEDNENERAVRKEPIHDAIKPDKSRRMAEQI